ncbi:MAG: DUF805 domain-containing protein [Longimicrobiales bacterium]|jgi:uncharacterized membrane protein YhaH (DUF805 family)|nr:DUF805 domain-containing protein [Gemmatimonadales bacterium]MBT6888095.1 DUF805 domain-containing protein [Gemmatimonadales bacterium]MDG2240084.1 DUF805 domain-containing protein [Longimicrobiales bacterium]
MICGCNVYGYHKASLPPFRPGGKTVTRNGYGRLDGRMDKFLDLFTMEGRANRAWYFWHIILDDLAILTAIAMCAGLVFVTGSPLFILPGIGAVVAGLWAGIAITVKRLHDLDRPGWHWFLLAVPLYNIYLAIVLLFGRGSWGQNQFGADPLQAAQVDGYFQP